MAEHQVLSCGDRHNSYSRDFVSHPNAPSSTPGGGTATDNRPYQRRANRPAPRPSAAASDCVKTPFLEHVGFATY